MYERNILTAGRQAGRQGNACPFVLSKTAYQLRENAYCDTG